MRDNQMHKQMLPSTWHSYDEKCLEVQDNFHIGNTKKNMQLSLGHCIQNTDL